MTNDMALQQLYVDPKFKSSYMVILGKDHSKTGFIIHSDGSIRISNGSIIEVPELRNSIQDHDNEKYLHGWLEAQIFEGKTHS